MKKQEIIYRQANILRIVALFLSLVTMSAVVGLGYASHIHITLLKEQKNYFLLEAKIEDLFITNSENLNQLRDIAEGKLIFGQDLIEQRRKKNILLIGEITNLSGNGIVPGGVDKIKELLNEQYKVENRVLSLVEDDNMDIALATIEMTRYPLISKELFETVVVLAEDIHKRIAYYLEKEHELHEKLRFFIISILLPGIGLFSLVFFYFQRWQKRIVAYNRRLNSELHYNEEIKKDLSDKEKFLANIFSSIKDGLSILDLDMRILRVNQTMEEWYSHAMPLTGKKCYEAYHGKQEACACCPVKTTIQTEKPAYEVVPFTDKEKKRIGWMDLYSFPMFDEKGKLSGVIEYVRDITVHKQMEEAVIAERDFNFQLINKLKLGFFAVGKNSRHLIINDAFSEMTGFSKEELFKQEYPYPYIPKGSDTGNNAFRAIIEAIDGEYEADIIRNDGSMLRVVFIVRKSKSPFGEIFSTVIARDITEEKKIERMKDTLIRDVSHELKTPAAMISMAYDMCQEGLAENNLERIKKAQLITGSNIIRMRKDIDSILSLFRLQQDKKPVKMDVSLVEAIKVNIEKFYDFINSDKLEIEFAPPPEIDTRVFAVERDIDSLFFNILDNAFKFTPEGRISITINPRENEVEVVVRDTGYGFNKDIQPGVFNKFSKERASVAGTGLGLAICKEIIDRHNGKLEIYSEGRDKGTSVKLIIPRGEREK